MRQSSVAQDTGLERQDALGGLRSCSGGRYSLRGPAASLEVAAGSTSAARPVADRRSRSSIRPETCAVHASCGAHGHLLIKVCARFLEGQQY